MMFHRIRKTWHILLSAPQTLSQEIEGLRRDVGVKEAKLAAAKKQLRRLDELNARRVQQVSQLTWERDQLKQHVPNWREVLGLTDPGEPYASLAGEMRLEGKSHTTE